MIGVSCSTVSQIIVRCACARWRPPGRASAPRALRRFSLNVAGLSRGSAVVGCLVAAGDGARPRAPGVTSSGGAHFSFGARVRAECSWELARLLNPLVGRQAARNVEELAEAGVSPPRGRLGLNAWSRARTCQAATRTLRATADLAGLRPWRLATSR